MPVIVKNSLLACLALVLVLALEHFSNLDVWLQNFFYVPDKHQWLINPQLHKALAPFFYNGPKVFYALTCVALLVALCSSYKFTQIRPYIPNILVLLLSLILVPTVVAGAKYFTNVYCPYQLNIYNGLFPFVRVLDSYPADFVQIKEGRCFPAGHATVGFAFMALYYFFEKKSYRISGLIFGVVLGGIAAFYQMLRGQHFLSHSLFSLVASFWLIMVINFLVRRFFCRKL